MLPEELRCAGRRATDARKHQTRRRSRLRAAAPSVPDDTPPGRTVRRETPPEFRAYSWKIFFATKKHKTHKTFRARILGQERRSLITRNILFVILCLFVAKISCAFCGFIQIVSTRPRNTAPAPGYRGD